MGLLGFEGSRCSGSMLGGHSASLPPIGANPFHISGLQTHRRSIPYSLLSPKVLVRPASEPYKAHSSFNLWKTCLLIRVDPQAALRLRACAFSLTEPSHRLLAPRIHRIQPSPCNPLARRRNSNSVQTWVAQPFKTPHGVYRTW